MQEKREKQFVLQQRQTLRFKKERQKRKRGSLQVLPMTSRLRMSLESLREHGKNVERRRASKEKMQAKVYVCDACL